MSWRDELNQGCDLHQVLYRDDGEVRSLRPARKASRRRDRSKGARRASARVFEVTAAPLRCLLKHTLAQAKRSRGPTAGGTAHGDVPRVGRWGDWRSGFISRAYGSGLSCQADQRCKSCSQDASADRLTARVKKPTLIGRSSSYREGPNAAVEIGADVMPVELHQTCVS
jgi:hypothetical protein